LVNFVTGKMQICHLKIYFANLHNQLYFEEEISVASLSGIYRKEKQLIK